MEKDFSARPLAFTDIETTGLDPTIHEIIEIGLVVAEPRTLTILDKFSAKVNPEHPEIFDPKAYELNGYNEAEWQDAIPLAQALVQYNQKTKEAIFAAYNAAFDWPFLRAAFTKIGIEPLMDHHFLDLFSMAWLKLKDQRLQSFKLAEVAKRLGVAQEPLPHQAINGARTAYEVYKCLITR